MTSTKISTRVHHHFEIQKFIIDTPMNKNLFTAPAWLSGSFLSSATDQSPKMSELLLSLMQHQEKAKTEENTPVPAWDSRASFEDLSAPALAAKEVLAKVLEDVCQEFQKLPQMPRHFLNPLYEEFVAYANKLEANVPYLSGNLEFWNILKNEKRETVFTHFLDNYTRKVAAIFLQRLRLVTTLSSLDNFKIGKSALKNPTNFFLKVFKKGSSREFDSKAMQSSLYSWYRPSDNILGDLNRLAQLLPQIPSHDILRLSFSLRPSQQAKAQNRVYELEYLQHYGSFLTSLLLSLPPFLEQHLGSPKRTGVNKNQRSGMGALCCKFIGQKLTTTMESHFLSQEHHKHIPWKQIICPEFKEANDTEESFLPQYGELLFLCFIAELSKEHQLPGLDFIADIMQDLKTRQTDCKKRQASFFDRSSLNFDQQYDAIVINFSHIEDNSLYPKVFNTLHKERNSLRPDGLIYVFSSQKLLVPSKNKQISQLLKKYHLLCNLTLKNLNNRREIAPYIYVFSPKSCGFAPFASASSNEQAGNQCLSLRISGDIKNFQDINSIVYELENFYFDNFQSLPSLFQKEISENFLLEAFSDTIIEGKLLHFTNKDLSRVTHPVFLKKILKNCLPFEQFFSIHNYKGTEQEEKFNYPLLLIIDARNQERINLEIVHGSQFKAKSEEYGFVFCHYFGLIPKLKFIDPNLFKEFFASDIGKQLIDITFGHGVRKIKQKLSSMLIPRFFLGGHELPLAIVNTLAPLLQELEKDDFSFTPEKIIRMEQSLSLLKSLSAKYPDKILSLGSFIKDKIQLAVARLGIKKDNYSSLDFDNSKTMMAISQMGLAPIYPGNPDAFVEFHTNKRSELEFPLTSMKLAEEDGLNNVNTPCLRLKNNDKCIVAIYSSRLLLNFIQNLLQHAQGASLSKILLSLQIPSGQELEKFYAINSDQEQKLSNLLKQTGQILSGIFTQHIAD